MSVLKHLDLFSGLGGFALAVSDIPEMQTVHFVEKSAPAQALLKKRFRGIPIHDDVRTFKASPNEFDVITAGYPCQDISPASHTRTGIEGDRSGLFYEVLRILREAEPSYLVLENSAALLTHRGGRDMRVILGKLSESGYDAQWSTVSACSMGAPHVRERLFIVAYPNSFDVERVAFQRKFQESLQEINNRPRPKLWAGEPPDPRVANGGARRMDRMIMTGNAVVPTVARIPMLIAAAMNKALIQ